jgi:hypothetical protein
MFLMHLHLQFNSCSVCWLQLQFLLHALLTNNGVVPLSTELLFSSNAVLRNIFYFRPLAVECILHQDVAVSGPLFGFYITLLFLLLIALSPIRQYRLRVVLYSMLSYMYFPGANNILQSLGCTMLPDGSSYWNIAPYLSCRDPTAVAMKWAAVIGIPCWVVLWPIIFGIRLRRSSFMLHEDVTSIDGTSVRIVGHPKLVEALRDPREMWFWPGI